jgi:hypothetical protein
MEVGVWSPFILFFLCFSSFRLSFIGVPMSQHPWFSAHHQRSRVVFDCCCFCTKKYTLASYTQEGKSESYFHCVKRGILGVRTDHGFGSDWDDLEEDRLIGEGFCMGDLGRIVYFQVVASGSQHFPLVNMDNSFYKLKLDDNFH